MNSEKLSKNSLFPLLYARMNAFRAYSFKNGSSSFFGLGAGLLLFNGESVAFNFEL
jgi:hypothetical protein